METPPSRINNPKQHAGTATYRPRTTRRIRNDKTEIWPYIPASSKGRHFGPDVIEIALCMGLSVPVDISLTHAILLALYVWPLPRN